MYNFNLCLLYIGEYIGSIIGEILLCKILVNFKNLP